MQSHAALEQTKHGQIDCALKVTAATIEIRQRTPCNPSRPRNLSLNVSLLSASLLLFHNGHGQCPYQIQRHRGHSRRVDPHFQARCHIWLAACAAFGFLDWFGELHRIWFLFEQIIPNNTTLLVSTFLLQTLLPVSITPSHAW